MHLRIINPLDHVAHLLKEAGQYSLTDKDHAILKEQGIEQWLYRCITSTRFRKWRLPDGVEARVRAAITYAIKNNEPIKFVFEFGGYKLWRLSSTPEIDWAEFFTLAHYSRYLAPMAAAYKPGVIFSFASDDHVVERMNNISSNNCDDYCASFQVLLAEFKNYLPSNLKMDLVRLGQLYDDAAKLETELTNLFPVIKERSQSWPDVKRDKMARKAELNFCRSSRFGGDDLEPISSEDYNERLLNSSIWHDVFEESFERKKFVHGSNRILIFTTSIPQAVAIGVTKSSVAKFWAGMGMLDGSSSDWRELVLSPTQLDALNPQVVSTINVPGMKLKNLQTLPIINL